VPEKPPPPLQLLDPADALSKLRVGRSPSDRHPDGDPVRPPWTWSLLDKAEAALALELVGTWVRHYNLTHATQPAEIVPPCWPQHPGLAEELAVLTWLHHDVHAAATAVPAAAAEYYGRHLPGFRGRVKPHLGTGAESCWDGAHSDTWRYELDKIITAYPEQPVTGGKVDALSSLDHGFAAAQEVQQPQLE
jgi:hypothetical protein